MMERWETTVGQVEEREVEMEVVAPPPVKRQKKKHKEEWGLTVCRAVHGCPICDAIGGDASAMRKARDAFVSGYDVGVLEVMFDLPGRQAWYDHARRHGWMEKRRPLTKMKREELVFDLLENRYLQTRHLFTEHSADSALAAMVRLQTGGQKISVTQQQMVVPWERIVQQFSSVRRTRVDDGEE